MKITEELIHRFFRGQCSEEEAAYVAAYLEQHDASAMPELAEQEWNEITDAVHEPLPEPQRTRMLMNINTSIRKKRHAFLISQSWKVAATLFLLLFSTFFMYRSLTDRQPRSVLNQQLNQEQQVTNQQRFIMLLQLKDGSKVHLYPQATLTFAARAFQSDRSMTLSGKAFFEVSKDKTRPFVVISGAESTTALGTSFMVNASPEKPDVSVQLFEGRVVIKSLQNRHKPVYLKPEQAFIYEKQSGRVLLQDLKKASLALAQPKVYKPVYTTKKSPDLIFMREPIDKVFAAVEQAYHINLIYPKAGFKDHYFSGSFNAEEDSLGRVLHILSETNKLNIIKIRSGYKILKSAD